MEPCFLHVRKRLEQEVSMNEYSDLICVTNRQLCHEDFLAQIEKTARLSPKAVILREKDLTEEEYTILAAQVLEICSFYQTPCILHSFPDSAVLLGCHSIHLPLPLLRKLNKKNISQTWFTTLGASCHSVEDALEAEKLGCTYITAGHVFETDCKKGLPGRGLAFLEEVCRAVSIPVYAIGGISPGNYQEAMKAGAAGACMMSGFMTL